MQNDTTETTLEGKTDSLRMLKLPGGGAANSELLEKAACGDIDALVASSWENPNRRRISWRA